MTEGGLTAVVFGLAAWNGYVLATRLVANARVSWRCLAAALLTHWLLLGVFFLSSAVGQFNLPAVLSALVTCAVLLHLVGPRPSETLASLAGDLERLVPLIRQTSRWAGLVPFTLLASAVSLRFLRGLVAPPLAWDALTYHLFKAGRWVQTGSWQTEPAPDAWGYYAYFLPGGDIWWAFTMLPGRTDTFLAATGLGLYMSLGLAGYCAASLFTASRRTAALCAGALCGLPSVLNYLTAAYVDIWVLTGLLASVCFSMQYLRTSTLRWLFLSVASIAVLAATKHAVLPYAVPLWLMLCLHALRARHSSHHSGWLRTALVLFVPLLVCLPPYLKACIEQGSPVYPLTVKLLGLVLWRGNEQLSRLLSGANLPPALLRQFSWREFLVGLFWGRVSGGEHLNFGPGGFLVLVCGPWAWARAISCRETRGPALLLGWLALVTVSGVLQPSMLAQRVWWGGIIGRFLAPALAATILVMCRLPAGLRNALFGAVMLLSFPLVLPLGYSDADWAALRQLGPTTALAVVGAILLAGIVSRYWRSTPAAVAVAGLVVGAVFSATISPVRDRYRYDIYRAAAAGRAFDLHPLHSGAVALWPVWRTLDAPLGRVVAFSAGWDGIGHNWYRYPLLGSRLQNHVIYVSPGAGDGQQVSLLRPDDQKADAAPSWLGHLRQANVDVVVLSGPEPREFDLLRRHPDRFRPVLRGFPAWTLTGRKD